MQRTGSFASAAIGEILRKAPLSPEKVSLAWQLAAGPALSQATTVSLTEDGVLIVTAGTPHWAAAVRSSRGLLHSRLGHYLGDSTVTRIECR